MVKSVTLAPAISLNGSPVLPGDKSISHRALIFGALAEGTTTIDNLLDSGDVKSTWDCLKALGVRILEKDHSARLQEGAAKSKVLVRGVGLHGLEPPKRALDCGNSGTTMRLLMGILAGQPFTSVLTGDKSLRRRPMKRVAEPLRRMGAEIRLTRGEFAPVQVTGAPAIPNGSFVAGHGSLKSIDYALPVASAQLKSALLLAGLYADGPVTLRGKIGSRDHTERLLRYFGVSLKVSRNHITISPNQRLRAARLRVPGDPSSAAFWIAAALLVKDGHIEIDNVLLNPTRTGFFDVLARMGADIRATITAREPERVGRLEARSSRLSGTKIKPKDIPSMIDEIPLLAVVATQAHGITEIRGAGELRVKESDRIEAVAANLRAMGAKIATFKDGFKIEGPQRLRGAHIDSREDHRIAMAFSIAALIADGKSEIAGAECANISYPGFFKTLRDLARK